MALSSSGAWLALGLDLLLQVVRLDELVNGLVLPTGARNLSHACEELVLKCEGISSGENKTGFDLNQNLDTYLCGA